MTLKRHLKFSIRLRNASSEYIYFFFGENFYFGELSFLIFCSFFQTNKNFKCREVSVALFLCLYVTVTYAAQIAPDLRGKFCETRRNGRNGCCQGRQDDCSVPILGTLCYCDDFCDRTHNDDCCPDFLSICKGIVPPADTSLG